MRNASLLLSALALAAASLCSLAPTSALAEAPRPLTQNSFWYRHMVGKFEVSALFDGQYPMDAFKALRNVKPQEIKDALDRTFRPTPTPTAVNVFLVNTVDKLILIDTGASKVQGAHLGESQRHLREAGYDTRDVDIVLLTHLHPDHASGLMTPSGQPAYTNATIYVPKAEADYWLNPDNEKKADDKEKALFQLVRRALGPYDTVGRVKVFEGNEPIVPGITPIPTPGHTPGHTSYLLESRNDRMLVWGDIVESGPVQFGKPQATMEGEFDEKGAIASRLKVFEMAAKDSKLVVAATHMPYPGLGRVRKDGTGAKATYTWVPVDLGPLPYIEE